MITATSEARVYVGTYGKYNDGNIDGAWLDLSDFSSKDDFLEKCAELHADESDPEFMFQDHEGIPNGMISESHIDDDLWDWLDLDDDEKMIISVYRENIDRDASFDRCRDAYIGLYDSEEDWAYEYLESELQSVPENLRNYIDFESYAHDAVRNGDVTFILRNGEFLVFHNC